MGDSKRLRCCICGELIEGEWGNNPEPVRKEGRCCDVCNMIHVIPARMAVLNYCNHVRKETKR